MKVRTIAIPNDINDDIEADVQALIWNKEARFDANESGTEKINWRWLIKGLSRSASALPIVATSVGRLRPRISPW